MTTTLTAADAAADAATDDALPAPSAAAESAAADLLAHLAPLYPTIAAATKTGAGADAWVQAWARSIHLAGLSHSQIARGIKRLARGEHDADVPLSWSVFYRLCYDPWRDCNDPVDPAERERKRREFQARYPGAKFVN